MATIEERLEAITMNLEHTAHSLGHTRKILNILAEDQVELKKAQIKTERVLEAGQYRSRA